MCVQICNHTRNFLVVSEFVNRISIILFIQVYNISTYNTYNNVWIQNFLQKNKNCQKQYRTADPINNNTK